MFTHWQRHRKIDKDAPRPSITYNQWLKLLDEHENKCLMCHISFTLELPATVDHILSLKDGGINYIGNIQPLCGACNRRKGVIESGRATAGLVDRWKFGT